MSHKAQPLNLTLNYFSQAGGSHENDFNNTEVVEQLLLRMQHPDPDLDKQPEDGQKDGFMDA